MTIRSNLAISVEKARAAAAACRLAADKLNAAAVIFDKIADASDEYTDVDCVRDVTTVAMTVQDGFDLSVVALEDIVNSMERSIGLGDYVDD